MEFVTNLLLDVDPDNLPEGFLDALCQGIKDAAGGLLDDMDCTVTISATAR